MNPNLEKYIEHVQGIPRYSVDRVERLVAQMAKGSTDAKDMLLVQNLKLVVYVASIYRRMGFPVMELITNGNMGLMRAILKYKSSTPMPFLSYTELWVHRYILKYLCRLQENRIVRHSLHSDELEHGINRIAAEMRDELDGSSVYYAPWYELLQRFRSIEHEHLIPEYCRMADSALTQVGHGIPLTVS
jgi:RNA polymerase sigma factor (sigma-70 family)